MQGPSLTFSAFRRKSAVDCTQPPPLAPDTPRAIALAAPLSPSRSTLTRGADGLSTLTVRCGPLVLVVVLCDGCALSAWWRTEGGDGAGRAPLGRA